MHQQSLPGLQAKVVPQREQRSSMPSLLHDWRAMPERDAPRCAIVVGSRYRYDGHERLLPIQVDKSQEGTLPMKNPLDSLGQTITLGVVLTIVVILLIHAIA
jgi:hypothetical protein